MENIRTLIGDCLEILDQIPANDLNMIYLDPPFFTQKRHSLKTRDGATTFSFHDTWESSEDYADFLFHRIKKMHEKLSLSGSLFFHCDKNSVHIARTVLNNVFGAEMFQAEIIWTYKRWSNASKGLLPAHQNILFYSKSPEFKFNHILNDYSESTNLDQIVQKRIRDERNKTVYARDANDNVISNGIKKGVPLSDVWEIPYLNPKAKERVGYPTQKPILLLERIINLCTDPGDNILDPFCGSGTTLVAAKRLGRNATGIDISIEAIELTKRRLHTMVKTESMLMQKGRAQYLRDETEVSRHLVGIEYFIVQRNSGIDAILKQSTQDCPVFVRIQREGESSSAAASALYKAAVNKGPSHLIVVLTQEADLPIDLSPFPSVTFVPSTAHALRSAIAGSIPQQRFKPSSMLAKKELGSLDVISDLQLSLI